MGLKENQKLAEQYPILQYFKYNHLEGPLRSASAPFCTLAWKLVRKLPHNAETSTALRKLLESKDAAVRAALDIQNASCWWCKKSWAECASMTTKCCIDCNHSTEK